MPERRRACGARGEVCCSLSESDKDESEAELRAVSEAKKNGRGGERGSAVSCVDSCDEDCAELRCRFCFVRRDMSVAVRQGRREGPGGIASNCGDWLPQVTGHVKSVVRSMRCHFVPSCPKREIEPRVGDPRHLFTAFSLPPPLYFLGKIIGRFPLLSSHDACSSSERKSEACFLSEYRVSST